MRYPMGENIVFFALAGIIILSLFVFTAYFMAISFFLPVIAFYGG